MALYIGAFLVGLLLGGALAVIAGSLPPRAGVVVFVVAAPAALFLADRFVLDARTGVALAIFVASVVGFFGLRVMDASGV